jgi:hypothetical protein
MGKQVTFFALPTDIASIEVAIKRISPLIILHSRSNSSCVQRLNSINPNTADEEWLYLFLVRTEDVNEVIMKHVPSQNYWMIDVLHSPVIEFQRCFFDKKILRRGRAYFVEKYFDSNDLLIQKPEAFRYWANSVLTVIKSEFHKKGSDYIGADAAHWVLSHEVNLSD